MSVCIPEERRQLIPQLGTSEQPDPMVWVRLSSEALGTTWYVLEAQWVEPDATFYGYVVGWDEALTSFNCADLEVLGTQEGVTIAYDPTFTPARLSEVVARERGEGSKFSLGRVVATPGAVAALHANQQSPISFVRRHIRGDWGELDQHDRAENELSLVKGYRLLSSYHLKDETTLWIITEADRSITTLLLPIEY